MEHFEKRISYLTDPETFQVNRLSPRSDHPALDEQGEPLPALSLNGTWAFRWYTDIRQVESALFAAGELPDLVTVPGHLQLQGYDRLQYVNTQYPWDGRFSLTPPELPSPNPAGLYRRDFTLPADMAGKALRIRFDGVEPCAFVYLNGTFVGYSEDSFTPSEFDLTALVQPGENRLAVVVPRFCSGSWLEDQDFWRFSGIFRNVTLLGEGPLFIEDAEVKPTLDESLTRGELRVQVKLKSDAPRTVRLRIEMEGGEVKAEKETVLTLTKGFGTAAVVLPVQNPRLWSAETPELYDVSITLRDETGAYLAGTRIPCGFRRFEKKGGRLLLNGKPIRFNGVNRHEWNALRGRAIEEADIQRDMVRDIQRDIRLMKQNNINALRCSHYPNQSLLYRLADQYGLYVIDETNLETHGTWMVCGKPVPSEKTLPGDKPEWKEAVLDRGRAMLERDKNHPSILFWSCGNESYGGSTLFALAQWFRERDGARLVHYEGIFWDRRYPDTSDVESQMYTTPDAAAQWMAAHPDKPFLLCEYAHAMGNSSGNMEEYTALFDRFPTYGGGFVWDWIDQGLAIPKRGMEQKQKPDGCALPAYESGLAGARPTDGYFCGNGLLLSDGTPSPKLTEVKYLYQPLDIKATAAGVTVANRMAFGDAGAYRFHWVWQEDGVEGAAGDFSLRLLPGETAAVGLPLPERAHGGETVLTCSALLEKDTIYAPAGYEVAFGQGVLEEAAPQSGERTPARLIPGDVNLGWAMADGDALVQKQLGKLYSFRNGDREYLLGPVSPCFWRAPTDNDLGFLSPLQWGKWKLSDLYQYPASMEVKAEEGLVTVRYVTPGNGSFTVAYRFYGENGIRLTLTLPPQEGTVPAAGFTFLLPADFSRLRWYGNGMAEAAADRRNARRIGIWESTVEKQYVPYLRPQDCGNKTDVRWLTVSDASGRGLRFSGDVPLTVSALPYTSHELEEAAKMASLPPMENLPPAGQKTVVTVCFAKAGVGGDDSWGAPIHSPYLLTLEKGLTGSVLVELV